MFTGRIVTRLLPAVVALCAALMIVLHGSAGGRTHLVGGRTGADANPVPSLIPQSVSFVSARTGWVWGPAGWPPAGRGEPGVLARTLDGGRTWRTVLTPGIDFVSPLAAVGAVKFTGARVGYLYGSQLWYTGDGGRRWRRLALRRSVLQIVGSGSRAFALVLDCAQGVDCATAHLFRLVGTRLVPALPARVSEYAGVVVHGRAVYVLDPARSPGATLWASRDSGAHWRALPAPCRGSQDDAVALAAWSPTGLALACGGEPGAGNQAKTFYASSDGGRDWARRGQSPFGSGYVGSLAALNSRTWVLSEVRYPGLSISRDGGRRWSTPATTRFSGEWWGPLSVFGPGEIVTAPGTFNGHALAFGTAGARRWRPDVFAAG